MLLQAAKWLQEQQWWCGGRGGVKCQRATNKDRVQLRHRRFKLLLRILLIVFRTASKYNLKLLAVVIGGWLWARPESLYQAMMTSRLAQYGTTAIHQRSRRIPSKALLFLSCTVTSSAVFLCIDGGGQAILDDVCLELRQLARDALLHRQIRRAPVVQRDLAEPQLENQRQVYNA